MMFVIQHPARIASETFQRETITTFGAALKEAIVIAWLRFYDRVYYIRTFCISEYLCEFRLSRNSRLSRSSPRPDTTIFP